MSKIDDLLKTYCPNGVEYKPLLSVTNVLYGFPCDASKFNTDKQGQPLARIRDVLDGETSTYTTEIIPNKYKLKENDLLIGMDGNFHVSNWKMKDGILCQRVCKISSNDNECTVLNGFLSHLLKPVIKKVEDGKQSGTVKHLLDKDLKAIQIPVPPLEVQREIVQVLDSFTMLTAELSAELSARKKQYEYYRDQLLSFNNVRDGLTFANPESVRWMTLGEIATDIYRGSGITREQVTTSGIPCVRYGEIYTSYGIHFDKCISHTNLANIASPKYFEHGDILFAITGESIEDIAKSTAYVGNEKCLAGGDIVVLKHKQNPKYLSYALSTTDAIKQKGKGKVKSKVVHSSVPAISELKIPVPPIEIQNRIVKVLDNFDSICSDLQIGLPAEIDARKKQYEYYRDLLLSFEPIGTVLAKQASKQAIKQAIISLYQYVYGYVEVMLGEVATISRGGNFQKKDFAESGVPCIHYGQIYTRYGLYADKTISSISNEAAQKQKFAQPNDIVMAVTSENVEDVCKCVAWVGNEPIAVSGHSAIIHHNQNAKFLTYYFHTSMFFEQKRKLAHGTKVIEVTPDKLSDIKIPLPSLAEQERIVAVLDKFDALVNDLSEGLPAEIEARKRQYEYYRDKLLSFKKIA